MIEQNIKIGTVVSIGGMRLKFAAHALKRFSQRFGVGGHGRSTVAAMALRGAKQVLFDPLTNALFFWSTIKINKEDREVVFVIKNENTVATVLGEKELPPGKLRRLQLMELL